jgi:hypothetical protein
MKKYRARWKNGDTTPWWIDKKDVEDAKAGEWGDSFHGGAGVIETMKLPAPIAGVGNGIMSPQETKDYIDELNMMYRGMVI